VWKTNKIKETELIKLLETKFNADFGNATLKTLRKVLKNLYDPKTKSFICFSAHKSEEKVLEEINDFMTIWQPSSSRKRL